MSETCDPPGSFCSHRQAHLRTVRCGRLETGGDHTYLPYTSADFLYIVIYIHVHSELEEERRCPLLFCVMRLRSNLSVVVDKDLVVWEHRPPHALGHASARQGYGSSMRSVVSSACPDYPSLTHVPLTCM